MCIFLLSSSLLQSLASAMSSKLHPSPAGNSYSMGTWCCGHHFLGPYMKLLWYHTTKICFYLTPLADCSALLLSGFQFPSKPQLASSSTHGCQDSTSGGIFSIFVSVTSPEEWKGQKSSVGSPQVIPEKELLHPNVSCLSPPLPQGPTQRRARKSWSVMISSAVQVILKIKLCFLMQKGTKEEKERSGKTL